MSNVFSILLCPRRLMRMVLCLLLVLSAARLQAQDTRNEFWPALDVYLKLDEKSRLFFKYSATRSDDLEEYADGSLGAYFDFYTFSVLQRLRAHPDASRTRLLMIRSGYSFTPSDNTHTPTLEAQVRAPLPWGLLLIERNRGDFRFVDGDYEPRYRNRLKLEHTLKAGRLDLTPYGYVEVFYDWEFDKFDRFRFAAGAEVTLGRHVIFEGYYLRQKDTTSSPQYVNAVGATLQLHFR